RSASRTSVTLDGTMTRAVLGAVRPQPASVRNSASTRLTLPRVGFYTAMRMQLPAGSKELVVTAVDAESRDIGLLTQILRFVLVGGLSAVVDYGTYQLFVNLGIWVHIAKAMSFILGTTTAYLLNRKWTFNAANSSSSVAKFALLYTVT